MEYLRGSSICSEKFHLNHASHLLFNQLNRKCWLHGKHLGYALAVCPACDPSATLPFVLFVLRNFFENQEKPPEPKPVLERKKSREWKPKAPSEEKPKAPAPPVVSPKPVREKPKPKEPQNQADLVRQALLAQQVTGPVKPETSTKPRSNSEPPQVVSGMKCIRSMGSTRVPEVSPFSRASCCFVGQETLLHFVSLDPSVKMGTSEPLHKT